LEKQRGAPALIGSVGSLQERITAYANASASLLAQLKELDELRSRIKKAKKLSNATPKPLKQKPACLYRRAATSRARWR
jgi:hypothetical protein